MRNLLIKLKDGTQKIIKASSQGQGIGYGTAFAMVADALGIKKCPGCKKREGYFNRLGKIPKI